VTGRAGGRDGSTRGAGPETGTAVVIVNYESGPALVSCVEGWRAEHPGQLVVVDNGSTDGSVRQLGSRLPGVEVLVTGRNLGYGAAANRGVAATSAPLVLVCNPDLEVRPGALASLERALAGDAGRALVGPLIRTPQGARYPSARRFPSMVDAAGHALLGIFAPDNRFTRSYQQTGLDGTDGPTVAVDWVSGACFLVRRSAFEQVGGFDEAYFMYAEDVDLCWRLGRKGWSVGYATGAEVVHVQGVSTDRTPYRMIAEHHRSLLRFAVRSTDGWRRALLPLVTLGISIRALLACLARARAGRGRDRGPRAQEVG
jgi:N-acetylglucosaminyl-diphospho-decaprenol L-rhamnosyltransferase